MKSYLKREEGSATIYVMAVVTLLTTVAGVVLRNVQDAHTNTFRAAGWEESLLGAESGIDFGVAELLKTIEDPRNAWQAPWTAVTTNGVINASAQITTNHAGEGGVNCVVDVRIDSADTLVDSKGWRYYRVRATGTQLLSGSRVAGMARLDADLRKYSLQRDRQTGDPVAVPQVSRTIEAIVRPKSPFTVAVLSRDAITLTNHNVVIDSYDSRDPRKSTLGQWDPAKRLKNGDVATDGTFISAGEAQVFGSLYTNGGTVSGVSNVTGQIRDDFFQKLSSINDPAPGWPTSIPAAPISGTTTLYSGPTDGAQRYTVPSIALSGGSSVLTIKGDPVRTTYVDILVEGDIKVTGSAQILVDPNVVVSVYAKGNVNIQGLGMTNGNQLTDSRPGHFLLFGVKPLDGSTKDISIGGNGNMEAAVYAPDAAVTINGGGSSGSFSGSVVGKSVFMNGVTTVHYDEALAGSGIITDYKISSWVEDSR